MKFLLICSVTAILQVGVGEGRRIAGGDRIPIEDAPYTVSLQILLLNKPHHHCGGALISDKFVLTAAHCEGPEIPVKVRLGSKVKDEGGTLVDIAAIEIHPSWDKRLKSDSDLAVVRLQTSVAFSERIEPIEMVNEGDGSKVGEMTKVSGWGETGKAWSFPKLLRAVEVPIVSLETCRSFHFKNEPEVTERMICAGFLEGDKDACNGDSGGPMKRLSDGLLIGIVSWGDECNTTNHPGVYTKIASFRGWIRNVTGI